MPDYQIFRLFIILEAHKSTYASAVRTKAQVMQSTITLKIYCLLLRKRITLHDFRDLFSTKLKKGFWTNCQVYKYAHTFHIRICFSNHLYKPFRLHMALINNPFTNNILSSKKKKKNPKPFSYTAQEF